MKDKRTKMKETSMKIDKPVLEWFSALKGLMQWKQGKKYTLNEALIVVLTDCDIRCEIAEGHLDENNVVEINEYIKKRLKHFWGNNPLPDVSWRDRQGFFNVEYKPGEKKNG